MQENRVGDDTASDTRDMVKAMYNFKASFAKTLSFSENEFFLLYQSSTKQRNWWQVINASGQVGYIPANHVCTVKVSSHFWNKFIDKCISCLKEDGSRTPVKHASLGKDDVLTWLLSKRCTHDSNSPARGRRHRHNVPEFPMHSEQSAEKNYHSLPISATHSSASSSSSNSTPLWVDKNRLSEIPHQPGPSMATQPRCQTRKNIYTSSDSSQRRSASLPALEIKKALSKPSSFRLSSEESLSAKPLPAKANKELNIEPQTAYYLVERIRKHTQLSHEMSRVAVTVLVEDLISLLPPSVTSHLSAILFHVQGPLAAPAPIIEETHDAQRLHVIFTELMSCKEDEQQRSWMLHEDEITILEYLKELSSILMNADANISRHVMSADQYEQVSTLVQYYQMEVRWSIRQQLLEAFNVMCSLDVNVVMLMLNSVLPMELARDMRTNSRNIPRLSESALLLTKIFSMGDPMPVTHLEHLGQDFVTFLLDTIQNPPDTDVEDQIGGLFINLILAYNLQFITPSENIMLKALSVKDVATTFTEKILLLLNREEDPVRIFEHQPAPPHSVVKLFTDLFSNEKTASLFYTNDVKVLIDIIVRQLSDLSSGDKRRQQYLILCRLVMRNTPYSEHMHRRDDMMRCFTRIFCEESELNCTDQQLMPFQSQEGNICMKEIDTEGHQVMTSTRNRGSTVRRFLWKVHIIESQNKVPAVF